MTKSNNFPKGIPYIIGNETAERFSYYGMKAILIVFMTQYLNMSENESTIWLHSFGIAVYWFPIIGAFLAEVLLGKYKTIMSLSIVYVLGHLALALFETKTGLAVGLTLIAIGSGGIKPCVSAHVGDQFTNDNKHLIERMFSYFYIAINMGAFISTLATPILLQVYGPSVAFGIPGVLMLIATIIFWMGRNKFVAIRPFGKSIFEELKDKTVVKTLLHLVVIYAFLSVFWSLFDQTASTWILQARNSLVIKEFSVFGKQISLLPSQIQAANPILVLLLVPLFTFVIYPFVAKFTKVTPLRKITFGMLVAGFSFMIVAWIEGRIHSGIPTHINWQFFAYAILTAAEVMVSITALEFSYTQAPNRLKSIIMGLFLISISWGNTITTVVNKVILNEIEYSYEIKAGEKTFLSLDNLNSHFNNGDKIDLKDVENYFIIDSESDKKILSGTFIIDNIQENTAEIVSATDRNSIKTIAAENAKSSLYKYSLQGASYFNFFAYLMFITAFVFIIVAYFYSEKTYIQSLDDIE